MKWVEIPDSLQHFEVVDKSKIDSVFANQKLTGLSQTIIFTSFDSGKWVLPAFDVNLNPSNGDSAYHLSTDTFPITVSYQADTTKELRDIKPIHDAKQDKPFWYWPAIIAGIILLIVLAIWLYFSFIKKKKPVPARPALTAFQQAMQGMEKLKQLSLSDVAGIKMYHIKLKEILKEYLSDKEGPYFTSSTTSEVLMLLNQKGIDKANLSKIADAIRYSDAAKFAKYIPSVQESEASWEAIKFAIDFTEQLNIKKAASDS